MSLGLLEDVFEDGDVSAQGLFGLGRIREALQKLRDRGIRVNAAWLPVLLAILAAIPDLIEAIEKFIELIRKSVPAPAPTT